MQNSVVISDVHLSEAAPGDGLWFRYRQARFFPDQEFAELFEELERRTVCQKLELIFNGDLFDFDAVPGIEGRPELERWAVTEPLAAETLGRILDDHAVFLSALGRWLAAGHDLVFVSGNHDAQLAFPEVRRLLEARLRAAASVAGAKDMSQSGRITFRTWFYTTQNGVHVEHGNQYDRYCTFRYPTEPFNADGTHIQPTVGSLTYRHLASRMGYINPHVDSSFMLTFPQYLKHWIRYYLFTRRSPLLIWIRGVYATAVTTWRERSQPDQAKEERMLAEAHASGAAVSLARQHAELFAPPTEEAFYGLLRELWVDRVALVSTGALVSLEAWHVGTAATMAKVALGAGASITGYEVAVPKPKLDRIYQNIDTRARAIARIYNASAVVFGHTHIPGGTWEGGVFFGNSGTWSPSFKDVECTMPVSTGRPLIWLRGEHKSRPLQGGLYIWDRGELRASVQRSS